jgi:hypothetical protein
MKILSRVFLGAFMLALCLSAGTLPTINYELGAVGNGVDRYTYVVSNLTLAANEEIDLEFDATEFSVLSNPVAGSKFSVLLFQPNNPLGAPGDLSIAAISDGTVVTGPVSVDFTFTGVGNPGPQTFEINQYDANGNFVGLMASGSTSLLVTGVPEPSTSSLVLLAIALSGCCCWIRRGKSSPRDPGKRNSVFITF